MSQGHLTTPIRLDDQGKDQLRSMVRSRSQPHGMVQHARIVLACAEGESHVAIGSRLGISKMTVGKWRRRYLEQGIEGDLCRTVPKPCKPLLGTRFWQYEASPEAAVFRDYVCQSQLKTSIQTLVLASLR